LDNYLEKNYPFTADITALGLQTEGNELFSKRYPEVNTVLYDGGIFPFDDKKWATGDAINLLSKRNLKKILNLAGVKSYTIKHNRLLGFTMDFCVVIKD